MRLTLRLVIVMILVALVLGPQTARAQCTALVSNECRYDTGTLQDYEFTQSNHFWTVIGVVPKAGDDKDIAVYTGCGGTGSTLAGSYGGGSGADFVVGDFNFNTLGTYYARTHYGSITDPYTVEWSASRGYLAPGIVADGVIDAASTGECAAFQVWDVYLYGGADYVFHNVAANPDVRTALFRNPVGSDYWTSRLAAEWEIAGGGSTQYTAPSTGWYGLVVFADASTVDNSYAVSYEQLNDCETLTTCWYNLGWPSDYQYDQLYGYWTVVGVAPVPGDDKDIQLRTACDGGGTFLGASTEIDGTDFVVTDHNHTPTGTYYARVTYGSHGHDYVVDWDSGPDIFPQGTMVEGEAGNGEPSCDIVKIWDISLTAGETYIVSFTRGGTGDARVSLFQNPGNTAYTDSRYNSLWELDHTQIHQFTAPATDWYGLVVFSDAYDEPAWYTLKINNATTTDVGPENIGFALHQNVPNPFNPSTTIAYQVESGGARVVLRVYDVAGSLVATLVDRDESAGEHIAHWDGRDDKGRMVASGLYFYRLTAPGFDETRKMVLLQ